MSLPSKQRVQVDGRRAERLEQNAQAFAAQLKTARVVTRNWQATESKALRNEWGVFSFTVVEQPAAINPAVDVIKSWRPHHYLLQGVFTKGNDVDATHDFPIFLRRVAHYLGAVNPLEMRNGQVADTPGSGPAPVTGSVILTPAQQGHEVITLRWNALP